MPAPGYLRVTFTPSPDLYPFTSRWFESPVGRMHYLDEGEGLPILFFHGNPTWSFLYRHVIVGLRDRYRCLALDQPGFGLSDRPLGYRYTAAAQAAVCVAWAQQLNLDRFLVMGQDWGGPMALAVATAMPERVEGIICGNTWYWPDVLPRQALFSRLLSTPLMRRLVVQRNLFVERLIPAGTAHRLSAAEMAHYRGVQPVPAARPAVAEAPHQILAARPWLTALEQQVLATLTTKPLLLTWGTKDPMFPHAAMVPRWVRDFPDTVEHPLDEASHFFQEDAGPQIVEAIGDRFPV
jgi:haloalkane dehalogenase